MAALSAGAALTELEVDAAADSAASGDEGEAAFGAAGAGSGTKAGSAACSTRWDLGVGVETDSGATEGTAAGVDTAAGSGTAT